MDHAHGARHLAVRQPIDRLQRLLGVRPFDRATIAGVAIPMIAVVFVTSYVPARRAASTDPAVALRAD